MDTYKAVMRPDLEYASSIWSPLASSTSINKRQVMDNAALRTATGAHKTQTYKICMTLTLPIHEHLQFHASQCKTEKHKINHIPYTHTTYFNTARLKHTIINNGRYTTNLPTYPHTFTKTDIKNTSTTH